MTVNAYLGGPNSRGFDLHIDHHDVLVTQVAGEKDWEIRPPTLNRPLVLPDHITEPQGIIWQGTLASGDILYHPRGRHRASTRRQHHFT